VIVTTLILLGFVVLYLAANPLFSLGYLLKKRISPVMIPAIITGIVGIGLNVYHHL
jgi:hypothetical protein